MVRVGSMCAEREHGQPFLVKRLTLVDDSSCWILLQANRRLAGTVNWGTATVVGIFAGMLYGGSKEAAASVVSLRSL